MKLLSFIGAMKLDLHSHHRLHSLFAPASNFHYWLISITRSTVTSISAKLKEIECLYHGQVQTEQTIHMFIRANYYAGLNITEFLHIEL